MKPDENMVVRLIREHGVFGLGGSDGCACTDFRLGGIGVDISCRKSGGSGPRGGIMLRVESGSMDAPKEVLEAVAKASAESLREGYSDEIRVRYCTLEQDEKAACVYCGKTRKHETGYLCEGCATTESEHGPPIREVYGYAKLWRGEPEPADV